ncbi:PASTA domain-containing protein [[Clostridium] spiroforme]|nr:PASTA domain-containing protein [Thomasclavelia spiroformis]
MSKTRIGNGKKVIDQLPRKGEYIDSGDTVILMLG